MGISGISIQQGILLIPIKYEDAYKEPHPLIPSPLARRGNNSPIASPVKLPPRSQRELGGRIILVPKFGRPTSCTFTQKT